MAKVFINYNKTVILNIFAEYSIRINDCSYFESIYCKYELICYIHTTPSMAIYSSFRGLTMLKSLSIHSKIATIISSSSFGAGLKYNKVRN